MLLDRVIIFAIGGYALLDAVRRRYMPMQREVYFLLFLLITVLVLVRLARAGKIHLSAAWIAGGLMALVGFSVMPVFSDHFDVIYFVGDMAIISFLLVMMIASKVIPEVFSDPTNQKLLLVLLLVAMFVAPVVQAIAPVNDQFAPPHLLLVAASWAALVYVSENRARFLVFTLLIAELLVAYNSEQRTNVLLWFGFGFLAFMLRSTMRQKLVVGTLALAVGLVAVGPGSDTARGLASRVSDSVIEGSRFSLLEEGPDESLVGRYLEVQDVWLNMEEDWTPANWLLGAGHGATYRPFYWYPERNMKAGRTHNIHFGPMLIFFRYGFVGVGLLLAFVGFVAVEMLNRPPADYDNWQQWWNLTAGIACVGAVLTFFLSNTLQDPVVVFSIAAFLSLSRTSIAERPAVANAPATMI